MSRFWLAASLLAAGVAFAASVRFDVPDFTTTAEAVVDGSLASRMRDVDVLQRTSEALGLQMPPLRLTAADLADRIDIAPRSLEVFAFRFHGNTAEEAVAIGRAAIDALAESQKAQGRQRQELRLAASQELQILRMYLTATNAVLAFLTTQEAASERGSVASKYIVRIVRESLARLLGRVGEHQNLSRDHARQLRGTDPIKILAPPVAAVKGHGAIAAVALSASLSVLVFIVVLVAGHMVTGGRVARTDAAQGAHQREDAT